MRGGCTNITASFYGSYVTHYSGCLEGANKTVWSFPLLHFVVVGNLSEYYHAYEKEIKKAFEFAPWKKIFVLFKLLWVRCIVRLNLVSVVFSPGLESFWDTQVVNNLLWKFSVHLFWKSKSIIIDVNKYVVSVHPQVGPYWMKVYSSRCTGFNKVPSSFLVVLWSIKSFLSGKKPHSLVKCNIECHPTMFNTL